MAIGTSAFVGRWDQDKVSQAWSKQNDAGGKAVRKLAEDFEVCH